MSVSALGPVLTTLNRTGIDGRTGSGDHLEGQPAAIDFHEHETEILIEGSCGHGGAPGIAASQLTRGALDKVEDPFLRGQPFIDVVVARKDDADTVCDEQRLEQHTHVDRRPMRATIGVERMMEITDLPLLR